MKKKRAERIGTKSIAAACTITFLALAHPDEIQPMWIMAGVGIMLYEATLTLVRLIWKMIRVSHEVNYILADRYSMHRWASTQFKQSA